MRFQVYGAAPAAVRALVGGGRSARTRGVRDGGARLAACLPAGLRVSRSGCERLGVPLVFGPGVSV